MRRRWARSPQELTATVEARFVATGVFMAEH